MNVSAPSSAPSPGTPHDPRPHAVIIGSGFGGLAAAVRLGARGYRVTILEARDRPGGRASVHTIDGFTFDGGPTVITAPFLLEELWNLAGRSFHDEIDLRPVDPFYHVRFHDGSTFDYTGDPVRMNAEIEKYSPRDVDGYAKFLDLSRRIFELGFEQLSDVPFERISDMVKIAPEMIKLQSYRTVYGLIARYIKDERLRQVFSFHTLLVGGNPFTTTSIYALIAFLERKWGVHWAMGGTGVLVRGLLDIVQNNFSGSIRLNARVDRILIENRRATGVQLHDGTTIEAEIVVSNADTAWTYKNMIGAEHRRRWTDRKLEKVKYSMSLFVWYFGTKKNYPEVPHHSILLGPRYKGLLDDIFNNHHLSDDFSLYLHRPTATDPSMAPSGCESFYVLSPVPHLDSKTDWRKQAEPYRKKIEAYLSSTVLPGLENEVIASRVMTPLDFRDDLLSVKGAAFGFQPILLQSAYFRPHNRSEDIDGLYLVGASSHPGAGVPGVLSSAKLLDRLLDLEA